jgi:type II secretory pathway component PulF
MSAAFKYRGYDGHGQKVEGTVQANSLEEAERRVQAQGVVLLFLRPEQGGASDTSSAPSSPKSRGKISDSDRAVMLRNLSVMITSGVPLIEALQALRVGAKKSAQEPLTMVEQFVVQGSSLSAAFRSVPGLFPNIVSDMIKVAEEGGRLDQALANAADYTERIAAFRRKLMNAMLYPLIMLGVSMITVFVLIVFVMPRFGTILSKMKTELPATTRAMLALGDGIRSHPLQAAGIMIGIGVAIFFLFRIPAFVQVLFKGLSKLPGIGALLKQLALARSFTSISTLLRSNVPLLVALDHGANVSGHPIVEQSLRKARAGVEHGEPLYKALEATHEVPALLLQLVAVGEKSGNLHMLLGTCASRLEEEADALLKSLVALVEPLMIIVMGVIVGGITLSIIGPIYSVVENVK